MLFITVIVSVYNIENYISECLDSILSQTFRHFEIIIVDDGSTDNSSLICDEYQSKNPQLIRVIKKTNGGLSSARNTGIKNAIGNYCYFVDGDDIISKDTLFHFAELIDLYGDVDFIHGRMSFFSDDMSDRVDQPYYLENSWFERIPSGQEMFSYALNKQGVLQMGVRGLYKTVFLISNSLFFVEKKISWPEDEEWTPRVFLSAKKCLGNDKPDYYYRMNRNGSETTKLLNCESAIITLEIYNNWFESSWSNDCILEFGKSLRAEAGNRTLMLLLKYSRLNGKDLSKFINALNSHKTILEYASPNEYLYIFFLKFVNIFGICISIRLFHIIHFAKRIIKCA